MSSFEGSHKANAVVGNLCYRHVMRVMEAARDAPNLASAVNIGAFNLGNAIGAALGGAVINAGLGYPAISLAGAAMAALGLVMVLLFTWRARAALAGAECKVDAAA